MVERGEQDRRPDAGEVAAHVPERGQPGGEQLLGEAQQVDLCQRLLVVRQLLRRLPLLVRRLEHAHPHAIAGLGRVLVVPRPQPLVVVGVQRRDQDRRGAAVVAAAAAACHRRRHRCLVTVVDGFWQYALLPGAREDLVVLVVCRDGVGADHPDLHADPPRRRSEVRVLVPGDQAPHGVARVEQVPEQEVGRALPGREQPPELVLERGDRVQRRREVEVAVQQDPVHLAERELVLAAEEGPVRHLPPQAQVHVRRHGPRRRRVARRVVLAVHDDLLAVEEARVRLLRVVPEPEEVGDGEVLQREQPRRAREGLAEEVGGVRRHGDEEDAAGEERVEEAADHGEHAVAEAVEGEPHDVPALHASLVGAAAGAELLDGPGVERRAGGAPPVAGLVGTQLAQEVRRRRVGPTSPASTPPPPALASS